MSWKGIKREGLSTASGDMSGVEKLFRRYMGIAKAVVPSAVTENAVKGVTGLSGEVGPELTALGIKNAYDFREREFYSRAQEIIAVASTMHPVPALRFNYMDIRSYGAISQQVGGEPYIFIDGDLIHFWFAFFTLRLFEIHAAGSYEERRELDALSSRQIETFIRGERVYRDEKIDALYFNHANRQLVGVGASLSRVIAYFVIAHEVAHHCLNHLTRKDTFTIELEADELGARIFLGLRDTPGLEWASVPDAYLGAPILFFELMNAVRLIATRLKWTKAAPDGYPSPRTRRARIAPMFTHMSSNDVGLTRDLRLSIARLNAVSMKC